MDKICKLIGYQLHPLDIDSDTLDYNGVGFFKSKGAEKTRFCQTSSAGMMVSLPHTVQSLNNTPCNGP